MERKLLQVNLKAVNLHFRTQANVATELLESLSITQGCPLSKQI